MTQTTNLVDFTRINSDVNGNPRFVCHFLAFINEGDKIKADTFGIGSISHQYLIAQNKAKQLGGRKFHNKQYGGGIVFQMYSGQDIEMSERIAQIRQINTNFLKEWQPYGKMFNKVKKAIYNHFQVYRYQWQPTHDKASKKPFYPMSWEDIDEKLGFAYTSTGMYAGLFVCNGGYMWADDEHYFNGFAINENGQVIGIAQDFDENEVFIEL